MKQKVELAKCPKCDERLIAEDIMFIIMKFSKEHSEDAYYAERKVYVCKSCGAEVYVSNGELNIL